MTLLQLNYIMEIYSCGSINKAAKAFSFTIKSAAVQYVNLKMSLISKYSQEVIGELSLQRNGKVYYSYQTYT